ncbi:helix-turn-helix transcriptional regulator [Longispora sp. K20-0274]|uniref:helix-turn-helix domain-containing protein n=1 Tax=Longispora sp. K20-0274 TaxID=3088255 RepID=UPI00399B0BEA
MSSPFVRRRQSLAREIIALCKAAGMTTVQLGAAIGVSRQRISRILNGHSVSTPEETAGMLAALDATEETTARVIRIAEEARAPAWWASIAQQMGTSQALYAEIESGARRIQEYQMVFIPGLLQTREFAEVRTLSDRADWSTGFDPQVAVRARLRRQEELRLPCGPEYEVVIDAMATCRLPAPAAVMLGQLLHLAEVGRTPNAISIRVLPLDARLAGHVVPKSAFGIYSYPDDPPLVAVDTVTEDLLYTDGAKLKHYENLYQVLREASLSPAESVEFFLTAADDLARQIGRTP